MRGTPFAPTGSPSPLMDGLRPIFVEHGADPTVAPGFDAPMGSMLRFGTDYYEKRGPERTDWVLYPPASGLDWPRALRPQDAGATFVSATTRVQFAGYERMGPGTSTAGIGLAFTYSGAGFASDFYFAIPEYFPRSGAIRRMTFFAGQAGFNANARIQLHLYSSGFCNVSPFIGFPYPDQLLLSGTEFAPLSSGVAIPPSTLFVYDTLTNYHVDGGSVVWFVMRMNGLGNTGGQKTALMRGCFSSWMGFTLGSSDPNATGGTGFYHAHTYAGGAAQTFPQTTPLVIPVGTTTTTTDVPAIGYGFQADL